MKTISYLRTWSGHHWWSVCRSLNSCSRKRSNGSANFLAALCTWWQQSPSISSRPGQCCWILVSRPVLLPLMTAHESSKMLTRCLHGIRFLSKNSQITLSKLAALTCFSRFRNSNASAVPCAVPTQNVEFRRKVRGLHAWWQSQWTCPEGCSPWKIGTESVHHCKPWTCHSHRWGIALFWA